MVDFSKMSNKPILVGHMRIYKGFGDPILTTFTGEIPSKKELKSLRKKAEKFLELIDTTESIYDDIDVTSHNVNSRQYYDSLQVKQINYPKYVYLMYDESTEFGKIGISSSLESRIGALRVDKPNLKIACHFEGNILDERRLQKKFKSFQVRGEWFKFPESQFSRVKELFTFYGENFAHVL